MWTGTNHSLKRRESVFCTERKGEGGGREKERERVCKVTREMEKEKVCKVTRETERERER